MNETSTIPERGRCRVVIENVTPELDAGRFPIKRTAGERVVVEADIFADWVDIPLQEILELVCEGKSP